MYHSIDQNTEELESGKHERKAIGYLADHPSMYQAGQDYTYTGTHYAVEEELQMPLRRWLMQQRIDQNNNLVANITPIIRTLGYAPPLQQLPFWTGPDQPPKGLLIPFRNGILRVDKWLQGETLLLPHTPNFRCTYCLPFDFHPDAKCDLWKRKLGESFDGDQPQIDLMQEWFGYVVSGDTSFQVAALDLGPTRCLKSVISRVLQYIMGVENTTACRLKFLADKHGTSALVGKALAVVSEIELKSDDKAAVLETIKGIIGNDCVEWEFKFKGKHSGVLPTRLHMTANAAPVFFDAAGAMAERLLIFKHPKTCPEDQREYDLFDRLCLEGAGIALWALEGLRRLQQRGRFDLKVVQPKRAEFGENCCLPLAFLKECCLVHESLDPGCLADVPRIAEENVYSTSVDCRLFFQAAAKWAEDTQKNYKGDALFGKDLRELMPTLVREKRQTCKKRSYHFLGVALNNDTLTDLAAHHVFAN